MYEKQKRTLRHRAYEVVLTKSCDKYIRALDSCAVVFEQEKARQSDWRATLNVCVATLFYVVLTGTFLRIF